MRGREGACRDQDWMLQLMEVVTDGWIKKSTVCRCEKAIPLQKERTIKGPEDIMWCLLHSFSSLFPKYSPFSASPCHPSYSYFTAFLVSFSLRCHLAPLKTHLPLAQVSSAQCVQRWRRKCCCVYMHTSCIYTSVWAGFSTVPQLWYYGGSHICFIHIITRIWSKCVKGFWRIKIKKNKQQLWKQYFSLLLITVKHNMD